MNYKFKWFSFLDLHYANSIFLYKKIDGYGEKIRAFGLMLFHSLGFAIFIVNLIEVFFGPIAPFVRHNIPYLNRNYNNAAEYILALPVALIINYILYWRRDKLIVDSHDWLKEAPIRWLAGAGGGIWNTFFCC